MISKSQIDNVKPELVLNSEQKADGLPSSPAIAKPNVVGSFVKLNRKFNNRSHAEQLLEVMEKKGLITNYRISWDTQLRMVVEVVYKSSNT